MRALKTFVLFSGIVALSGLGCQAAGPASLSDADKAAIKNVVDGALSMANSESVDWSAYTKAYYAADAVLMPPNSALIQGHEAITSFLSALPVSEVSFDVIEVEGIGDWAYVRGKYSLTLTLPGAPAPVTDTGKYIEIWRRQADGSWRVSRDIFNTDMPFPPQPQPIEG